MKKQTLCELLGLDEDEVTVDGDTFTVNEQVVRWGDSPDKVKSDVESLKQKLVKAGWVRTKNGSDDLGSLWLVYYDTSLRASASVGEDIVRKYKLALSYPYKKEAVIKQFDGKLTGQMMNRIRTANTHRQLEEALGKGAEKAITDFHTLLMQERAAVWSPTPLAAPMAPIKPELAYQHWTKKIQADFDECNLLYSLLGGGGTPHSDMAIAAFEGKVVKDLRPRIHRDSGQYRVLTVEEADTAAAEYIRDTIWAFNPDWLAKFTGVKSDILSDMQNRMCESANPVFEKLLGDRMDEFISASVEADGRGNFLATYDGEELSHGDYLIYRVN